MTVFLYDKSGIVVPKFVTDLIEVSYFGRNLNAGDGSKSKIRLKKTLSFQLTKNIGPAPVIVDSKIRNNSFLILRKIIFIGKKRWELILVTS